MKPSAPLRQLPLPLHETVVCAALGAMVAVFLVARRQRQPFGIGRRLLLCAPVLIWRVLFALHVQRVARPAYDAHLASRHLFSADNLRDTL